MLANWALHQLAWAFLDVGLIVWRQHLTAFHWATHGFFNLHIDMALDELRIYLRLALLTLRVTNLVATRDVGLL